MYTMRYSFNVCIFAEKRIEYIKTLQNESKKGHELHTFKTNSKRKRVVDTNPLW